MPCATVSALNKFDIGVDQKQFVQAAPAVLIWLAAPCQLGLELFPEAVGLGRIIDMPPQLVNQLAGVPVSPDPDK